ncbi:beta-glucosidase BglX [Dyella sp. KRB-257]|uniref:beta-glucosidase BglX n=1 Tax=Dyella sp. KRB-257 TaxID=3400915 RepID=UPI003C0F3E8D
MKRVCVCSRLFAMLGLAWGLACPLAHAGDAGGEAKMHRVVDGLLSRMTLEEKVGQLSILGADRGDLEALIREGRVGGTNGVLPGRDVAAYTRHMQQLAMQSRLKIPLWFMGDVSHGFRTIFPIPLALASTWDPDLVRRVHRAAAREATAAGVDWSFSPMVDISRDPRWGRVAEGAGEDPYLGSAMAVAQLEGFQRDDLAARDTMMATAKHFVGYGAVEAGRDYNATYLSQGELDDVYLPPFHALVKAGIGAIMPSLSTLNDVPATADATLLQGVLRQQWGFRGLVVSDFDAVAQLQQHGLAATPADAARLALDAGVDIDLHSGTYLDQLPALVRSGQVDPSRVDAAVRRVLEAKYRLGLFDDPFRYGNRQLAASLPLSAPQRALAREVARTSMVLLKNAHGTLPLARSGRIAVIGPLADDRADMLGQMAAEGQARDVVPILDGIRQAVGKAASVSYVRGVDVDSDDTAGIPAAVAAARTADVVVLVLGEDIDLIGEGHSRSTLDLPGRQRALAEAVVATGRPVVAVLVNGRPLSIPWLDAHADAILEAWVPGDEAGHAVADLLFGDAGPSGKLPMSFPRTVGQVPIYYAHRETGRPCDDTNKLALHYSTHYVDVANTPLYPFGYGLAYTTFAIDRVRVEGSPLAPSGVLIVRARVRNTGQRAGTDVVQLYVHDRVASVSPPVRLLKGFQRVSLPAGAQAEVRFTLRPADLAFRRGDGSWGAEPGDFDVYVGDDATATAAAAFTLTGP